jgi:acetyl-CoA acetyltransferase
MSLREKGAITGVGETVYSRSSGKSVAALQMEAALAAIADAGLDPKDIDGIIAYATSGVVAEDFVTNFGIPDLRFSATTPMGGASCVAAVQCAIAAIGAGISRHVLIPLGRNGASESRIGSRAWSASSRCRSGPSRRPSSTLRWRAGTWSATAPPPASSARSR